MLSCISAYHSILYFGKKNTCSLPRQPAATHRSARADYVYIYIYIYIERERETCKQIYTHNITLSYHMSRKLAAPSRSRSPGRSRLRPPRSHPPSWLPGGDYRGGFPEGEVFRIGRFSMNFKEQLLRPYKDTIRYELPLMKHP